ncbi:hypothetical protein AALP_AAs65095U000100 [Arabis alpina]|uniref:Uncharacterized protein n=1 Tax=Arabis alpina TaxID=50452 RepID=A0A087G3I7_ARAAL|nr:hypothetical protein AALP_AAs65095U000100 [Arabis alpina]
MANLSDRNSKFCVYDQKNFTNYGNARTVVGNEKPVLGSTTDRS